MTRSNRVDHIRITSHPAPGAKLKFPIAWGAASARERGPVIGTVSRPQDRNVIGTHGGSYSVYRALAVSSGALDPIRRPDLTNTHPAETIGPFPQWAEPQRIVSLDPWGHLAAENFASEIAEGIDIRPSIAITRARLDLPELQAAIEAGRLKQDGEVVHKNGSVSVVKIAIDPVWYLPGLAARFATTENNLRRQLFEQTAGMFPELVTRPDLQVFLPPIGGTTAYLFGDVTKLPDYLTRLINQLHHLLALAFLSCRTLAHFRQRTAAPRGISDHLVDHTRARGEVLLDRLSCHCVRANDFTAVGGADPERFPVKGDAARFVRLRLERAQNLAVVVAHQVRLVSGALIHNPQAVFGRLQPIRLRSGRLEDSLNLPHLANGDLAEVHGRCRAQGRRRSRECEKVSTFHHVRFLA